MSDTAISTSGLTKRFGSPRQGADPHRQGPTSTSGLTKRFGSLTAVDDLTLEVRRGEVFGYLGPNGAGKTTTIRLLLDFIRPTAGSYTLLGGTGADPEIRRCIGYLPGDLKLDRKYAANDLIAFYGKLRGAVDEGYVRMLCRRFDLDPARPSGELSTGNRRKIGIIQAFMHQPELLILDEPTSGLDPLLQHEFQQLVKETVAAGATVFLSSHVLPEVEALADRVGIIRTGQLVTVSAVPELRRHTRQRIDLHLADGASADVFDSVPGVISAGQRDGVISVVVEGSVDQVIKAAARLEVERIETHGGDLEDVFLSYYEETPA